MAGTQTRKASINMTYPSKKKSSNWLKIPMERKTSVPKELYFPTAWKVAPGVCWIQCNDPQTAKRLSRLKDSRLVAVSRLGDYLRTYEVPWNLLRAKRWIKRRIKDIYRSFSDQKPGIRKFKSTEDSLQQANR